MYYCLRLLADYRHVNNKAQNERTISAYSRQAHVKSAEACRGRPANGTLSPTRRKTAAVLHTRRILQINVQIRLSTCLFTDKLTTLTKLQTREKPTIYDLMQFLYQNLFYTFYTALA